MRRRRLPILLAFVAVLAGCATNTGHRSADYNRPPREVGPAFPGTAVLSRPDMVDDGPGSLIDVLPLENDDALADADATAVRVIYRSTDHRTGKITPVSGVVAVPPGDPPTGGWPIVSFGHPLVGVTTSCGPSQMSELAGYAAFVASLLNRGYVVAMSDYQGLGIDGPVHSLLDSATLGNNLIDVVRAARRVVPATSHRWSAYGLGQGGLAAWAADERAETYGTGLDLVGVVALSPFADLSDLAFGAATGVLRPEQYPVLVPLLQSVAVTDPSFVLDDYRSGLVRDNWGLLLNCGYPSVADAARIYAQMRPADLRPVSTAAAALLHKALSQAAMPTPGARLASPMLVIYATEDPLIPAAGIERSLDAACKKGEQIDIVRRIGDLTTYDEVVSQASLNWMQSRFDGVPADNLCAAPA